eukprot:84481-Pyramimonas_sp.AAC.1
MEPRRARDHHGLFSIASTSGSAPQSGAQAASGHAPAVGGAGQAARYPAGPDWENTNQCQDVCDVMPSAVEG